MATITISGLPEVSTIADYTNIPVETVGVTQRITGANLKSYLAALPQLTATSGNISGQLTTGSLLVNGAGTINGALAVTGITANTGAISNFSATNVSATTGTFTGNVNAVNVNASQSVYANGGFYGAVRTASQPNITSLGTLTDLTVTNTITGSVNGSAGTVTQAAQPNITSVGTLTSLSVSGTATIGTLNASSVSTSSLTLTSLSTTSASVTNLTIGATALPATNGTLNLGGPSNYFATVYGKATTAQYADLAECYEADSDYEPGTVLCFGATTEVTASTGPNNTKVAGVVSTNPAYLMNDQIDAKFIAKVALQGRVPCKVVGTIKRGDMLVTSSIEGVATTVPAPHFGAVIGKALQDYNSQEVGVIEVVVGRM